MLKFNSSGFLIPHTKIVSSKEELEQYFVNEIKSNTRKEIFDNYYNYSLKLKEICQEKSLVQWINGSFTTKKENPNDIDLVTFLDYRIINSNRNILKDFVYPRSLELFEVDAYLIESYPNEDKKSILYSSDKFYWIDQFTKTKRNRRGNRSSKGFLEVYF